MLITEKSTNLIDLYRVAHDGSLTGPTRVPSVGVYPFGMAFSHRDSRPELIVDDGLGPGVPPGTGAVTAYRLTDGQLQLVNGPVPGHQIAP